MPRYYVEMDGHAYGPFDRGELAQLRDDGILSGNSTAREEHSSDGVPLNELLQSMAAAPTSSAQAAAPDPQKSQVPTPVPQQPPAQPVPDTTAADASEPAAGSEGEVGAPPSSTGETWSERLSRLRSNVVPQEAGPQAPEAGPGSAEEEDDGAWAAKDAVAKPAPDFLVPENAQVEEGIQYKSALSEAGSSEEEAPSNDGFLPSLGFDLAPSSSAAPQPGSSELPPLGGTTASKAGAPSTWSTGLAGAEPGIVPPARADVSKPQAGEPREERTAAPAAPAATSSDPAPSAFEVPGPEWKQRMAQLDVIYGRPEGEGKGRSIVAGQAAPSKAASQAGVPSAGSAPDRPEAPTKSSSLLAGLALVVVGGVALMSGWSYVSIAHGPGLALAAAMAAYAGLSVNGGLLVWMRVKWIATVMQILLLIPLAVAVASCYYFKEDLLNLVIPASLQKPLMYDVAAMIVSAIGLASLPRRVKNAIEGD